MINILTTIGFVSLIGFAYNPITPNQPNDIDNSVTITSATYNDSNFPNKPTSITFESYDSSNALGVTTSYLYDEFGEFYVTGFALRWTGTLITSNTDTSGILFGDLSSTTSAYDVSYTLGQINSFNVTWRISCTQTNTSEYTWYAIPILEILPLNSTDYVEYTLTDIQVSGVTSTTGSTYSGVLVSSGDINAQYLYGMIFYSTFGETYQTGYDEGYTDGHQDGYSEGIAYSTAQGSTATTIFAGIIDVALLPINFFLACLNFEVFGINIGAMVTATLTIAILVILFRTIFAGGNGGGDK